jgi:hypothetical protein
MFNAQVVVRAGIGLVFLLELPLHRSHVIRCRANHTPRHASTMLASDIEQNCWLRSATCIAAYLHCQEQSLCGIAAAPGQQSAQTLSRATSRSMVTAMRVQPCHQRRGDHAHAHYARARAAAKGVSGSMAERLHARATWAMSARARCSCSARPWFMESRLRARCTAAVMMRATSASLFLCSLAT